MQLANLLRRSLDSIQRLITATIKAKDNFQYTKRILFPTDIEWFEDGDQQHLIDTLVNVLEKFGYPHGTNYIHM